MREDTNAGPLLKRSKSSSLSTPAVKASTAIKWIILTLRDNKKDDSRVRYNTVELAIQLL